MVCVDNFVKFFDDHPEFCLMREAVLQAARDSADERGIVTGGRAEELMGEAAVLFFDEIYTPAHVLLFLKCLKVDS